MDFNDMKLVQNFIEIGQLVQKFRLGDTRDVRSHPVLLHWCFYFLGAFVRLSVRVEQIGYHWTDFD
jgi:hypothetical protein